MRRAHRLLSYCLLTTLSVAALATGTAANAAQTWSVSADADYVALIRQYRRGDFQGAMAAFARWPGERVRASARVPRLVLARDLKDAKAAAMLHSDVSMLVAVAAPQLSRQHAEVARTWVRALPNEAARFNEHWQAYSLGPALVQHDLHAATLAVREGIGAYPRSALLQLMGGTVMELTARGLTADIRDKRSPNRRIDEALQAATLAFRNAIDLDAALVSAHLRLGWTYSINNSTDHAREELTIVVDRGGSREQNYLAHLMLGGLAEQVGQADLAFDEYERAHATRPDAQTAFLALIRAARMTGRVERAERLFAEYTARVIVSEDPWWPFSIGLDAEISAWLHAQATEP